MDSKKINNRGRTIRLVVQKSSTKDPSQDLNQYSDGQRSSVVPFETIRDLSP